MPSSPSLTYGFQLRHWQCWEELACDSRSAASVLVLPLSYCNYVIEGAPFRQIYLNMNSVELVSGGFIFHVIFTSTAITHSFETTFLRTLRFFIWSWDSAVRNWFTHRFIQQLRRNGASEKQSKKIYTSVPLGRQLKKNLNNMLHLKLNDAFCISVPSCDMSTSS